MEVSGQLYSPAVLPPGKEPLVVMLILVCKIWIETSNNFTSFIQYLSLCPHIEGRQWIYQLYSCVEVLLSYTFCFLMYGTLSEDMGDTMWMHQALVQYL
jgi:hypothetical protein